MFDETSGQVFKEWTVTRDALNANTDKGWEREPPWNQHVEHAKSGRGQRGPRSLVEMATHVVVDNLGYMTHRHIESIPASLRWRLWRFFEARYVDASHPGEC
jgi:hypothetical protein